MKRSDRLLGILLMLRNGRRVSSAQIAERFEVSVRTVYRDVDTLSVLGAPIYAERGRGGGFRLLEGYFLPAIAFSQDEAVSLLISLTLLRSLRAWPFSTALETAENKLLAAMPEHLGRTLGEMERLVGFEAAPEDVFHPERSSYLEDDAPVANRENRALDVFLQAILDGTVVKMGYHSPYREPGDVLVTPLGAFWDRDRWYLAGQVSGNPEPKLWRADRVQNATILPRTDAGSGRFDVRSMLGRQWLAGAMRSWREDAPVHLCITLRQAERLRDDWYYRHASFERREDGKVSMIFGEDDRETVFDLLRWLGPGAELIAPETWRDAFRDELLQILAAYQAGTPLHRT